ncbi:hypothetical protein R3W88_033400 [Solanum pinnatisectum]|uniref:Uncharacterized protein n=1 Tax=Solanum pinnatisectum TaxID=50273 RepID=A0AAV9K2V5_9SOLN|nr:hypothetical protein R3W88_033400 [Solanum pinnatisectum]
MGKERHFGSKVVLNGRNFHPEVRTIGADLFLDTRLMVNENDIVEFYVNLNVLEGNVVTSSINRVELLAFGNILTSMFKAFNVPLGEGRALNRNDMFTRSTLADCRLLVENN